MSILPTFYTWLFVRTFCAKFFCTYILGLNIFNARILVQKILIKYWWNRLLGVIFTNILPAAFTYKSFAQNFFSYLHFRFQLFWRKNIGANLLINWWNWLLGWQTTCPTSGEIIHQLKQKILDDTFHIEIEEEENHFGPK